MASREGEEIQRDTLPIQDTSGGGLRPWSNIPNFEILLRPPQADRGHEERSALAQASSQTNGHVSAQQNGRRTTSARIIFHFAIFYPYESEDEVRLFVSFWENCFAMRQMQKPRIWASCFDIDGMGRSVMDDIKYGLDHSAHYLLYVSKTFSGNRWSEFQKEQCFHEYFHGKTKKLIIPIKTEKAVQMPFGTGNLRAIEFWRITQSQTMQVFVENGATVCDQGLEYLQCVTDWFFKTAHSNQLPAEGIVQEMPGSQAHVISVVDDHDGASPSSAPLSERNVVTDGSGEGPADSVDQSVNLVANQDIPQQPSYSVGDYSTEPSLQPVNSNLLGVIERPSADSTLIAFSTAVHAGSPPHTDDTIQKTAYSTNTDEAPIELSADSNIQHTTSTILGAVVTDQATQITTFECETRVIPNTGSPQNAPSLGASTASCTSEEIVLAADLSQTDLSEARQHPVAACTISPMLSGIVVIGAALVVGFIIGKHCNP